MSGDVMTPTLVHVEAGMHLYGGALQVAYLLNGLRRWPLRNVLVCPEGSAIARQAATVVDRVYEIPMSGDMDVSLIRRLRTIIRAEDASLVHLHSRRGADVLGGIAARLEKTACVLSRRVDNPESRIVATLKYRLYDRVITISDGIRRVLLREGVPAANVVCVHSAVDADRFDRDPERDWFLPAFDLPGDARVLGMIAQLIPRKGHRYLLAALPEVLAACPDVHVLLFGQGPLQAELQQQLQDQRLRGRVRLVGFRDDLERILPCLYGVVHPADMEGLGVSLLQAAAAGVPLIGTEAGGIPEIVRHDVNGLLVPPGDVTRLRAALFRLLDDDARAGRWGAAGKRIVREEFSIEAMTEGNYRVYRSLLDDTGED
jgi:glycosyltransferase involved in cell wall biosynthesis